MEGLTDQINQQLSSILGEEYHGGLKGRIHGGCISSAYIFTDGTTRFFVKVGGQESAGVLKAEYNSLLALKDNGYVRVPKPICLVDQGPKYAIVIEWLHLSNRGNWENLGEGLANLHSYCQADCYGFETDNFIGLTPQHNTSETDWATFFVEHRLKFQIELANKRAAGLFNTSKFLDKVAQILSKHVTTPSLLHGDLWGGNAAFTQSGEPVIFDPATYFGDPEADLAMTRLFGGFPREFYSAYNRVRPPTPGSEQRVTIYNAYHIINHVNLFGRGYQDQAQMMINQVLDFC